MLLTVHCHVDVLIQDGPEIWARVWHSCTTRSWWLPVHHLLYFII